MSSENFKKVLDSKKSEAIEKGTQLVDLAKAKMDEVKANLDEGVNSIKQKYLVKKSNLAMLDFNIQKNIKTADVAIAEEEKDSR